MEQGHGGWWFGEEEVEEEETGSRAQDEQVVDSWEELVEEGWRELGRSIYDGEDSVEKRMEELKGLIKVFCKEGVEMRYKTPMDGNCFYHAVGEQVGKTALEVRREAVGYLRANERINGEEWSSFILDGERGKRAYLGAMSGEGVWTDHVMLLATSKALRRKIRVYSQTEKTTVGEGEEEVLVGYIREQHYFGVRRRLEVQQGQVGQ